MPALSIRGLTKRYGSAVAVAGLTLEIQAGEIFGLIGPNGAGKTTVLECVSGLRRPDAGTIEVGGLAAAAPAAAVLRRLGVALQGSALPDPMTPRQAARLCGAFYPRAVSPERLLARFGLGEAADTRYAALSGGQRQRLALALAFVGEPELAILDEPTAGLDPALRRQFHELIAAERAAGRTVLFSTHYLEEACALCDRLALIDRGRLVALGRPEALLGNDRPALDEAYLRLIREGGG
ncbi:MAG TPA: ABC transporter ATP-binding protein [Opitutaceae bacterium]|jgi:ABC-2 type transport system ATP-binding protein|nr:ABC transporter ATP-binding protein [Opitutaceae bacterium]